MCLREGSLSCRRMQQLRLCFHRAHSCGPRVLVLPIHHVLTTPVLPHSGFVYLCPFVLRLAFQSFSAAAEALSHAEQSQEVMQMRHSATVNSANCLVSAAEEILELAETERPTLTANAGEAGDPLPLLAEAKAR